MVWNGMGVLLGLSCGTAFRFGSVFICIQFASLWPSRAGSGFSPRFGMRVMYPPSPPSANICYLYLLISKWKHYWGWPRPRLRHENCCVPKANLPSLVENVEQQKDFIIIGFVVCQDAMPGPSW